MPGPAAAMRDEDRPDVDVDTDEFTHECGAAPGRARQLVLGAIDLRLRIVLPPWAERYLVSTA